MNPIRHNLIAINFRIFQNSLFSYWMKKNVNIPKLSYNKTFLEESTNLEQNSN